LEVETKCAVISPALPTLRSRSAIGSAVEQSDMRIDARNDLAVELEHDAAG
jgi:hypothetical protein